MYVYRPTRMCYVYMTDTRWMIMYMGWDSCITSRPLFIAPFINLYVTGTH